MVKKRLITVHKKQIIKDEVWKPAVKFGVMIPNYFVSNMGRVKKVKNGTEKIVKVRDRPVGDHKGTGRGAESGVTAVIPENLFAHNGTAGGRMVTKRFTVHRLVMETFMPIDENPPIPMKDWQTLPESAKSIIRQCCLVDHIDDNPFNNKIDNLRWVTPLENNAAIKRRMIRKTGIQENTSD